MKVFILLLMFFVGPATAVSAQSRADVPAAVAKIPADSVAATAAAEQLTLKYTLNPAQAARMQAIQLRKHSALATYESFKTTDPALYRKKMRSLQTGTLASIRQLMRTREQIDLYRKTQSDIRKQRSAKQEELAAQNAPLEALEAALLLIYAE
jgi:hypothetical protein